MTTSGDPTFTANRNQLITGALRLLRVVRRRAQENVSAALLADGQEMLNGMIKVWQADPELHVWTTTEATLFPQAEQVSYGVGDAATDHCTTTYTATTIAADEASGQTVLSVDSITGISSADHLGVQLDDGTIHWTTVSGAPSAGTVTAALAITDAASEGNAVFAYTSNIARPLKIVDARLYDIESGNETPLRIDSRMDYQARPNKVDTGNINSMFYDPSRVTGAIKLWQPPTLIDQLVKFTWHRPLDSFLAAGDEADFPQEWVLPIKFNLAMLWSSEFDVPSDAMRMIIAQAPILLDAVAGYDREAESIQFAPDVSDYR